MSLEADHIELANRNHETLLYLAKDAAAHGEWLATVAFYKAVHIVEAVFDATIGHHSNGHDARIDTLKHPKFADLFKAYRPLYAASLVARYLEDSSARKIDGDKSPSPKYRRFSDYIPPDRVIPRLLKKRLDVLEQHAAGMLSARGRLALKRICHASLP